MLNHYTARDAKSLRVSDEQCPSNTCWLAHASPWRDWSVEHVCVGDLQIPRVMSCSISAGIIFYELSFSSTFPWFPSCQTARRPDRKVLSVRAATEMWKVKSFRFSVTRPWNPSNYTLKCLSAAFAAKINVNLRLMSINQNTLEFFNKGERTKRTTWPLL